MKSFLLLIVLSFTIPFATLTQAEVENTSTQPIDTADHASYWTSSPEPYFFEVTCGGETKTVHYSDGSDGSSLSSIKSLDAPFGSTCTYRSACYGGEDMPPVYENGILPVNDGLIETYDKLNCTPPYVYWTHQEETCNPEGCWGGGWTRNEQSPLMRVNIAVMPEISYSPIPVRPGGTATVSWDLHDENFRQKNCGLLNYKCSKILAICDVTSDTKTRVEHFGGWFTNEYLVEAFDQDGRGSVVSKPLSADEKVTVQCTIAKKTSSCWGLCNTAWQTLYNGRASVVINVEEDTSTAQLTLSANPMNVQVNDRTRLTWTTQNVTAGSCTVSGGGESWTGDTSPSGGQQSKRLPLGDTRYTLSCQDLASTTVSKEITVSASENPIPLAVSCRANDTNSNVQANTNENVGWNATVSGGTGTYTYIWSGSEGLSGNGASVTKKYSTFGTKTAQVTVTSGTASITRDCSNTVTVPRSVSACMSGAGCVSSSTLVARPPIVQQGDTTTLHLYSEGVSGCSISSSVSSFARNFPVPPAILPRNHEEVETDEIRYATKFTARCLGADGVQLPAKEVTVDIVPAYSER